MVIEFKAKTKPVVIATLPPGPVRRDVVQKAIDEHFAPKPTPDVVIPVPKKGRPSSGKAKKAVTIRLDQDVVIALEAREDWRNEVNALLRTHLKL